MYSFVHDTHFKMSEIQKPVVEDKAVEATPVAEPVTEPATEPLVESKVIESGPATAEPVIEEPVAIEQAATEIETKPEAPKKEFNNEGVLGYKAPGGFLKKLAGFQKKFFWFGTDAIETKNLSNYLRGEKPEIGNHNAAWSSQTGQGLLYFSKHATEKHSPAGIINLADISEIKEDGTVDFQFISHGQKHVFQAASLSDRDAWVAALKTKAAEAKESVEAITASEVYKEQHSSLSKPSVTVAPVVTKVEEKKEDHAEAKEEKKEEKAVVVDEKKVETKEEKKARTKSRSASRKRNSIFGTFNLGGKKEEAVPKVEAKDEAKTETSPIEPAETTPVAAPAETSAVVPAVAPVDTPVEPAVVAAAEEPIATETTATTQESRPAASKRHSSIFDFKNRFGSKKVASETAAAPAVPIKDNEVVTSTEAPIIPAVEQSEPLATSLASPATVPTETTTAEPITSEASDVKAETKPEVKSDRRKSSLPFGFGAKKEKTTETEGEKSMSPFAKLRQTVKHKATPKPVEKTEAKTEENTEAKMEENVVEASRDPVLEDKVEEPVTPAPIQTSTPVVSATA